MRLMNALLAAAAGATAGELSARAQIRQLEARIEVLAVAVRAQAESQMLDANRMDHYAEHAIELEGAIRQVMLRVAPGESTVEWAEALSAVGLHEEAARVSSELARAAVAGMPRGQVPKNGTVDQHGRVTG